MVMVLASLQRRSLILPEHKVKTLARLLPPMSRAKMHKQSHRFIITKLALSITNSSNKSHSLERSKKTKTKHIDGLKRVCVWIHTCGR